jgi:hypothetical protein
MKVPQLTCSLTIPPGNQAELLRTLQSQVEISKASAAFTVPVRKKQAGPAARRRRLASTVED